MELPQSPGGPRGKLIVPSAPPAVRNISGSFIARENGELLYAWTASENEWDYSRSWIDCLALLPDGKWEPRGTMFPSRPDWPCVSRPSFVTMADGRVLTTYSIGRRHRPAPPTGPPRVSSIALSCAPAAMKADPGPTNDSSAMTSTTTNWSTATAPATSCSATAG